ncbi:MAG TPA: tandem-95 repeat protein, partial [Anaerolineae bacterium]|nr:tandem-95 repeat protein [Anaerolineae bacterium]
MDSWFSYNGSDPAPTVTLGPTGFRLQQTVSTNYATRNDTISYQLTLINDTPNPATNIRITNTIPTQIINSTIITSNVNITSVNGSRYIWDVATIPPTTTAYITITGTIDPYLSTGYTISNTAQMTSDNSSNDSVPAILNVVEAVTVEGAGASDFDGTYYLIINQPTHKEYRRIVGGNIYIICTTDLYTWTLNLNSFCGQQFNYYISLDKPSLTPPITDWSNHLFFPSPAPNIYPQSNFIIMDIITNRRDTFLPTETTTYTLQILNKDFITATHPLITHTYTNLFTNTNLINSSLPITVVNTSPIVWELPNLVPNDGVILTVTGNTLPSATPITPITFTNQVETITNMPYTNQLVATTDLWHPLGPHKFSATNNNQPRITLGPDNLTPYTLDQNGNTLSLSYWQNGAWQTLGTPIPDAGIIYDLIIATDGTPYVAYADTSLIPNRLSVRQWTGSNWDYVGTQFISNNYPNSIRLHFDTNETLYIAYIDGNGYVNVKFFNGADWQQLGTPDISQASGYYLNFDIDLLTNTPYLIFSDVNNSYQPAAYYWNGLNWQLINGTTITTNNASSPDIFIHPDGTPYAAYHNNSSGKIVVQQFTAGSWQDLGPTNFTPDFSYTPSLALHPITSELCVSFIDYRDNDNQYLSTMCFDGTNWNTIGSRNYSEFLPYRLQLIIDKYGRFINAYNELGTSHLGIIRYELPVFDLTKTTNQPAVYPHTPFTYTLQLTNNSSYPIYQSVVTDVLPVDLNYIPNTLQLITSLNNSATLGSFPTILTSVNIEPYSTITVTYQVTANITTPNASLVNTLTAHATDSPVAQTITNTILIANLPPTASPNTYTTAEDTPIIGNLITDDTGSGPDTDGDDGLALSTTINTSPASGTVLINPDGSFTYTPTLNYNGLDSFTYTLSDTFDTATATVTITITPVNDPPTPLPDGPYFMYSDGSSLTIPFADILLNDYDIDGQPISLVGAQPPSVGSYIMNANDFTYQPPLAYEGIATLPYIISDGTLTATTNITITIFTTNLPPTATH